MSQKNVEVIVGKLATDEELRAAFGRDPEGTLKSLKEGGLDLSCAEAAALTSIDRELWERLAGALDPRLQRASLSCNPLSRLFRPKSERSSS